MKTGLIDVFGTGVIVLTCLDFTDEPLLGVHRKKALVRDGKLPETDSACWLGIAAAVRAFSKIGVGCG
jgi:hypothetical protein